MTAEVAIVNSNAVALAADSAVTIGSEKIYNSALKLFSLSKTEPVGVMIYGNATLLQLPWETIIKVYRREISNKTFDTVEEYTENFLKYLATSRTFFPSEAQTDWITGNVMGYFTIIFNSLIKKVEEHIKNNGKIDDDDTKNILSTLIRAHYDDLITRKYLTGMGKTFESNFKKKHAILFRDLKKEIYQGLIISRTDLGKLYWIVVFIHTRDIFSEATSGLVIAGFGSKDIYPVVETHNIEGIVDGKLKYKRLSDKSIRITKGTECSIIPFAQDDMVASFMKGMNPSVHQFVLSYLGQIFQRLPDVINRNDITGNEKKRTTILNQYRKDIGVLLNDFLAQLDIHTQAEHVDPIMQMVHALPKDELAAMAESLVNLTAFKRRMTRSLETVGGPIDVAVISKGDGLVWVKRKHYFPPELNQHFFANYFRGVNNGGK